MIEMAPEVFTSEESHAVREYCRVLVRRGKYIGAIKTYREVYGLTLGDAKAIVDNLREETEGYERAKSNGRGG